MEAASRQLRRKDTLGRLGGEEFGLILPVTDLDGARTLAERGRQPINDLRLPAGEIAIRFTVSLGVAKLLNREEAFGITLKRADNALYQAKRNGRNQVVVG